MGEGGGGGSGLEESYGMTTGGGGGGSEERHIMSISIFILDFPCSILTPPSLSSCCRFFLSSHMELILFHAAHHDAFAKSDRGAEYRSPDRDPDCTASYARPRDGDPDLESRGGADDRDAIVKPHPPADDVETDEEAKDQEPDAAPDHRGAPRAILAAHRLGDTDSGSGHARARDGDPDLEPRGGADDRDALAGSYYLPADDVETDDEEAEDQKTDGESDASSDHRDAPGTVLLARQLDDSDIESGHARARDGDPDHQSRDRDPDLESRGGADDQDAIAKPYPHAANVETSDHKTGFECPN